QRRKTRLLATVQPLPKSVQHSSTKPQIKLKRAAKISSPAQHKKPVCQRLALTEKLHAPQASCVYSPRSCATAMTIVCASIPHSQIVNQHHASISASVVFRWALSRFLARATFHSHSPLLAATLHQH